MSEAWAAFGYDSASADDGTRLWSRIPRDVDVVVTHGPPRSHLDGRGGATGCKALNQTLRLVRPSLVVCGHVHESRGAERVRWGEGPEAVAEQVDRIDLPPSGSKKQSLVDLTGKRGPRLDNGIDDPAMEGSSGSLRGKKSRNETCIINASIMGTHWPHRGGKKFNAAIVVDLELPEGET